VIVGMGNGGTLLVAITDEDIAGMREGMTMTYEAASPLGLVQNVIMMHGTDRDDVIRQLRAGGVTVSSEMERAYRGGRRTDAPKRVN